MISAKKFLLCCTLLAIIILLASCSAQKDNSADSNTNDDVSVECDHLLYSVNVVESTCTDGGYTLMQCKNCEYSFKKDETAPLGHSLDINKTPAVCEEQGYTTYFCKCGYSYTSDYLSAKGHRYSITTISPDCENGGYSLYICDDCEFTFYDDFTCATGHTLSSEVISPGCIEGGYTIHSCRCGYSYSSDYTEALGHAFEKTVVYPTINESGYTNYLCSTCRYEYQDSFISYTDILPDGAYSKNDMILAYGIDISSHNHPVSEKGEFLPIDWVSLKGEGIDYVILKAGSSKRSDKGGKESTFDADYFAALEAGFDIGAYFYTYATSVDEIRSDAYLLLEILDGKRFNYPVYLDLEDDSLLGIDASTLTEMCIEFCTILQKNGYYAGVYVNNGWLTDILETEIILKTFEIWYARYPLNTTEYVWDVEKYGAHLGMWQYTDSGSYQSVPGIPIAKSYTYKNYPAIIQTYGFNGYEKE